MKILKTKTANVFSFIFGGFNCSYGDISVHYNDDYFMVKICAVLISF